MSTRSVSHIDIATSGQEVQAKFYSEIFGWETQTIKIPGQDYTVWKSSNMRVGFPNIDSNNKPGDVTVYLDSQDIEADLKKVEANGGKIILGKTEIPTVGWFAYFEDPSGNRLGLFTRTAKA
jgi:predicted enzyme related to lactoylglutathione lyase